MSTSICMYNLGDFIHSCDIRTLLTPLFISLGHVQVLDFRPKYLTNYETYPPLWIGHNHLKLNTADLTSLSSPSFTPSLPTQMFPCSIAGTSKAVSCSGKRSPDAPQICLSHYPQPDISLFLLLPNVYRACQLLSNSASPTPGHHGYPSELLLQPPNWLLCLH